MRYSIWYDTKNKLPEKTGYYLAYRAESLGDDTTDVSYYWYEAISKSWRSGERAGSHWARVIFWTDADPFAWDQAPPTHTPTPAEAAAWQEVVEAIERYKLVKALTQDAN